MDFNGLTCYPKILSTKKKMGEHVVSSVLSPELEGNTKSRLKKHIVARSLKGKVQVHIPFSIPSCLVAPQKYEKRLINCLP